VRVSPALWAALVILFAGVLPAAATVSFAYRWETPRVQVEWTEGNDGPDTPGLRREVAHWKRLAHSLWAAAPEAPPLRMSVTLLGAEVGSAGPRVSLTAGARTEVVAEPVTEEGVRAALLKVRGGEESAVPPDDSEPRVSPDGQWVSTVTWRAGASEVWVAKRDVETISRIPFPGAAPLTGRLIRAAPQWSPDSRQVGWVQGGRLLLFDVRQRFARLVTPAEREVVGFQWPPRPQLPLLVRFLDDGFALLDGVSGTLIPISDMVQGAAPTGEFFWSPSGRRLAFKTQSRIETAALTVPGRAASAWDRFLGRILGGPPEPPQPRDGDVEERLAVLDLGARRLDGYPVRETPLDGLEPTSVGWTFAEDALLLTVGGADDAWKLIRFPLGSGRAEVLRESARPLAALGWRPDRTLRADEEPRREDVRQEILEGTRLLRGAPGEGLEFEPAPVAQNAVLALRPGPLGGYLGVESEESGLLTEDEPGRTALLERADLDHVDRLRRFFPAGFTARALADGPLLPLITALPERGAVDLDYVWDKHRSLAVGMLSDGGVGRLHTVGSHPQDAKRAVEVDFSAEITRGTAVAIEPVDRPFELTDVSTGASTVALRYNRPDRNRLLLLALVVLLAFGILVYIFRRRLGR
jgi:hypothetical protein